MRSDDWVLYGANGYTGQLVARLAADRGARPVLAGRSGAVADLARDLDLPHRVVDLRDQAGLRQLLSNADAVLHCAGPFSATAAPVLAACLETGTHYADITGEIAAFELAYGHHDAAVAAGISLVPGVGYDVVPTDHLLARLHRRLPGATDAHVAMFSRGGFSAGTLRTVLEGVRDGGVVRRRGELVAQRRPSLRRALLDGRASTVMSAPLGDVASGFRATGIPNITTYSSVPAAHVVAATQPALQAALRSSRVHAAIDGHLAKLRGPSARTRAATVSDAWVELSDRSGTTVSAGIRVPNTYSFTAHSALHAITRLLGGDVRSGAWAPSQAFGVEHLRTIPGVVVQDLAVHP